MAAGLRVLIICSSTFKFIIPYSLFFISGLPAFVRFSPSLPSNLPVEDSHTCTTTILLSNGKLTVNNKPSNLNSIILLLKTDDFPHSQFTIHPIHSANFSQDLLMPLLS